MCDKTDYHCPNMCAGGVRWGVVTRRGSLQHVTRGPATRPPSENALLLSPNLPSDTPPSLLPASQHILRSSRPEDDDGDGGDGVSFPPSWPFSLFISRGELPQSERTLQPSFYVRVYVSLLLLLLRRLGTLSLSPSHQALCLSVFTPNLFKAHRTMDYLRNMDTSSS